VALSYDPSHERTQQDTAGRRLTRHGDTCLLAEFWPAASYPSASVPEGGVSWGVSSSRRSSSDDWKRSWFVRLKPGETVRWHTTAKNEEALVILHGQVEVLMDGQSGRPLLASELAYIPPATRHNVSNTGTELLEYVYVVAPAQCL